MSIVCKQCGAEVKDSICSKCGAEVVVEVETQELTIAPAKDVTPATNKMPAENKVNDTNTAGNYNPKGAVIDRSPLPFISFEGRMARWEYFIGNLKVYGLCIVALLLNLTGFLALVGIPLVILALVYSVSISVRRLHDMNYNGWLWLLCFVPIVNLILAFVLLFKKGTEGANDYGLPRV